MSSWLIACLFVLHVLSKFSTDHCSAKSSQNFTEPSAYVKFGLPRCLKLFGTLHILMCTHNAWKCAPNFCALSWVSFFNFWVTSWPKIKKRRPHLKKVWTRRNFSILLFFSFSVRNTFKMAKTCKNLPLRNKSKKKVLSHPGRSIHPIFFP